MLTRGYPAQRTRLYIGRSSEIAPTPSHIAQNARFINERKSVSSVKIEMIGICSDFGPLEAIIVCTKLNPKSTVIVGLSLASDFSGGRNIVNKPLKLKLLLVQHICTI